ncbi:hypothetical protein [Bacillus sp. FJAT-22090]|uniref:hypothetical protein n=1 Tax=Bacillus sp. FJAT-22090 TaxID=1581038 RepID=UPI0011A93F7E|nr:hypothetical protein [Bacillus sp. FJAT-22090]
MSNNGKWTFANLDGRGWSEQSFETKEQAISEAKRLYQYKDHVVVGQIVEYLGAGEYIENQEWIDR